MLDHGPSLEEHIPSQYLLKFQKFASREVNVLTLFNFDVSAHLKVTVTFEAPGTSANLGHTKCQ